MRTAPNFENVRRSYRPARITTLFVGESAPHGSTFFYNQDSGLARLKSARQTFKSAESFLEEFKRSGFYLDDLVLEPINHLPRESSHLSSKQSIPAFASRLKTYNPAAVVILLKSIKPMVLGERCDRQACRSSPFCTPYPGMGNQPRFHQAMAQIIPSLPNPQQHLEGTSMVIPRINAHRARSFPVPMCAGRDHAPARAACTTPCPAACSHHQRAEPLPRQAAKAEPTRTARRAYNQFYAGLQSDGRFPARPRTTAADLVLELHYELRPGEGDRGPHPVVDTAFARQFRLVLLDPRTHTVLWSLDRGREQRHPAIQSQQKTSTRP